MAGFFVDITYGLWYYIRTINKQGRIQMKTLIILQLLAGFILAMCGLIVILNLDIWAGLGVLLVGIYGVLRATHRINVCN